MPRVSTKKPRAKPAEETPAETPAVESAELTNGAVETAVMPEPSGSAALRPPSTPVELAEEPKVEEPRAEDRRGPQRDKIVASLNIAKLQAIDRKITRLKSSHLGI